MTTSAERFHRNKARQRRRRPGPTEVVEVVPAALFWGDQHVWQGVIDEMRDRLSPTRGYERRALVDIQPQVSPHSGVVELWDPRARYLKVRVYYPRRNSGGSTRH